MDLYQSFIFTSRYARWIEDKGRRETWDETVDRYITFLKRAVTTKHQNHKLDEGLWPVLRNAIYNMEVMPSMRALMTAGPAAERDNVCTYNCSALAVDHPRAFDEALYILMCGVGVGFSVERQFIASLPTVNEHFERSPTVIVVDDSKAGWARALRELISLLYSGQIPQWDLSKVRPAGARLKTFGGRASGPAPLHDLFRFCVNKFRGAAGRKLTSLECHDIMCKIGEAVVVGGVRRSAMISLSNLTDARMQNAKSGAWWQETPHRALANNSVAYTEKPDIGIFMKEWQALYDSKSGERGIFNRRGANKHILERVDGAGIPYRSPSHDWLTNPCGEIVLRPNQFCNLTEVVLRSTDAYPDIRRKVELATILGTLQATLTDFKYLRGCWKKNTEEERLLGVSLTGIMDNSVMSPVRQLSNVTADTLSLLRDDARSTNNRYADLIGISRAAAITTCKPSGTVSQLVGSSSGIHPHYSEYYIRRVRADIKDPLTQFMISKGVPCEPCTMKGDTTMVFSFPQKIPQGARTRYDISTTNFLELYKMYMQSWADHSISITINVKEDEWLDVGAWTYKNFDSVIGLTYMPHDSGTYTQAPYEEITEQEYLDMVAKMPESIDWSELANYEKEDHTAGTQTLACAAGGCEMVDINV